MAIVFVVGNCAALVSAVVISEGRGTHLSLFAMLTLSVDIAFALELAVGIVESKDLIVITHSENSLILWDNFNTPSFAIMMSSHEQFLLS